MNTWENERSWRSSGGPGSMGNRGRNDDDARGGSRDDAHDGASGSRGSFGERGSEGERGEWSSRERGFGQRESGDRSYGSGQGDRGNGDRGYGNGGQGHGGERGGESSRSQNWRASDGDSSRSGARWNEYGTSSGSYRPSSSNQSGGALCDSCGSTMGSMEHGTRESSRPMSSGRPFEGESQRGKGPKNYHRSDERIEADLCDHLTDDHGVDATGIECTVAHGEVTLTGTVRSRDEKRRAEEIAESVSGVKDVQNQIRVKKESGSDSSTSSQGSTSKSGAGTSGGSTAGSTGASTASLASSGGKNR